VGAGATATPLFREVAGIDSRDLLSLIKGEAIGLFGGRRT
jgi:hypothetical protein